jgi:hypothetical protein
MARLGWSAYKPAMAKFPMITLRQPSLTLSDGKSVVSIIDIDNRFVHFQDGSLLPITTFINHQGHRIDDDPQLGETAAIVAGPTSMGEWLTYQVIGSDQMKAQLH